MAARRFDVIDIVTIEVRKKVVLWSWLHAVRARGREEDGVTEIISEENEGGDHAHLGGAFLTSP